MLVEDVFINIIKLIYVNIFFIRKIYMNILICVCYNIGCWGC